MEKLRLLRNKGILIMILKEISQAENYYSKALFFLE